MVTYLSIYLILFLLLIKETMVKKFSDKELKILFILMVILLSFIAGIRYGIGADFFTYLEIFTHVNRLSDYQYVEIGFRIIIVFFKWIGFSEQSLFFIFPVLSLPFLFTGIRKNSTSPIFSVFIFVFVFYIGYFFNGLRQGIVMCLFVYLIRDIKERKFFKVLIFTLIGLSFHYSAIFIIISYFFTKIDISRRKYILLTGILILLILTNSYWQGLFIEFLPDFLRSRVTDYVNRFEGGVDFIGVTQRILIISLFLYFYPKLNNNDNFENIFKVYYLGFIFYALFSFQAMFATRINMFFRILEVILMPFILNININRYQKFLITVLIILWATLIFLADLQNPYNYPFKTIFK